MSYTVSLQQRLQQLKKAQADLPNIMKRVQKDATLRAIEAAADATPPKEGTGRGPYIGANTISGELKAHWETDSNPEPKKIAGGYETVLANDKDYASFVNNGHRMDKHFVPGLYINPYSGLLEYDPKMAANQTGGLMVGTKTKYVKGEFMVDKAKEAYEKTILTELDKEVREALK